MLPENPTTEPRTAAALGAERKLISVLFADVRGSTALVASLDPEDALARLEPVIAAMERAVHRYNGIISKEQGDGIMAFFGAPEAVDDHAVRACLAALDVHAEVKALAIRNLHVRVGVHSGEVVLQRVIRDLSSIYDAAGAVVHIAQKLEASAPPGGTLISRNCLGLTDNRFGVKSAAALNIVGIEPVLEAFELLATRPVSRWEARASEGLSKFVGRESYLGQLYGLAEEVASGTFRVAVIEGDPGNGKSRLAHEFLDWARTKGWSTWEAAAESTARLPWIAARHLLRTAFGQLGMQDEALVARIAAAVPFTNDEERCALLSLFGLPADAPAWRESAPEYRRHLTFAVFIRAFSRAISSTRPPLAVLIEDQHWLDGESEEALNRLVAAIERKPVLLIVTRRPHYIEASSLRAAAFLPLGSLSARESGALLDTLLGDDASLKLLKERIAVHTGGVPLFIEEVVRRLVDTGAIAKRPGGYRVEAPIDAMGIPPTVQGVIAGRIDRLPWHTREVLQIVAVLGQRTSTQHLRAVLGTEAASIEDMLGRLEEAALLLRSKSESSDELAFAHDLIYEVTYGGMVRHRRRQLHSRALRALTSLYGAIAERHADVLHRHAAAAEEWGQCVGYARIAAARTIEQSAYRNAVDLFEAALSALKHLEPSKAHAELEIDLKLEARIAFGASAQLTKMVAHAQEAEQIALSIGDRRRALAAATQKAQALIFLGIPGDAIAAGDAVLKAALAAKLPELEVVARYILGQANFTAGNFRATANLMAKAREQLAGKPMQRMGTTGTTLALIQVMEAVSLASMGEFEVAKISASSARRIAEETGRPYDAAAAAYGAGFSAVLGEAADDAVAAMESAIEIIRERAISFFFPLVGNQLGLAYAALGRPHQSLQILREALATAEQLGHVASRISVQSSLGQSLSVLGRWREADEILTRSHETAKQQGFKALQSASARLLAIARAGLGGSADDSERLLLEAIDVGTACDARPHVARARLTLAESHLRGGGRDQAAAELSRAIAEFRAMGMTRSLGYAKDLEQGVALFR